MDTLPQMTQRDYLRTYRRKLNMRQAEVADAIGCARTTIVALEQGVGKLSQERYRKLREIGFPPVEIIPEQTVTELPTEWELLTDDEKRLITAVRESDLKESIQLVVRMIE